jgi:hypothetical protein
MTDIGTAATAPAKDGSGLFTHQLNQVCATPIPSNNEFLSKEQQRAQFGSDEHRRFMRSLG